MEESLVDQFFDRVYYIKFGQRCTKEKKIC